MATLQSALYGIPRVCVAVRQTASSQPPGLTGNLTLRKVPQTGKPTGSDVSSAHIGNILAGTRGMGDHSE